MFGLFKRMEWESAILPQMKGVYGGIHVVISNLPYRLDRLRGKRTYAYPDFGAEFIDQLHSKLGDFEQLRRALAVSGSKTVFIELRELPEFQVEITGSISEKKRQFYSDIADALIEAFQSQGISP